MLREKNAHSKDPIIGEPNLTIRYGLLNLIAKKVKEGGHTILKIIIAHNIDYTSTYTRNDRERIAEQKM
jgi:hypothetical protein